MVRLILICLLIVSCGKTIDINVKRSQHEVIHKIDFSSIITICENQNSTNEEVESCINQYKQLLGL